MHAGADSYDILVVGAGTAGLPATIFAAARGLRVLLLEKLDRVGGTLHLATGQMSGAGTSLQRKRGIADSPDRHFADVMRISHGTANAELVRVAKIDPENRSSVELSPAAACHRACPAASGRPGPREPIRFLGYADAISGSSPATMTKGQTPMLSMLTLVRGTIDPSAALRSVATLQGAVGAELLVICLDLGPPFAAAEAEEAREDARTAYDLVYGTQPHCRFKVVAGSVGDALRKQSMFADLCALSRGSGLGGDVLGLLKAALVDSGAPTILLQPEPAAAPPATVVLSWNGQAATARAIRAALPFARQAKRVLVLEHAGNEVNRSRLEHFLGTHGIQPEDWLSYGDKALTARGRARALLAAAAAEGGDLLVMGAYGDPGERLFRFGRATEKVATAARIPVLFSC